MGRRGNRGRDCWRPFPIEQGADALESFLGGGAEPAVGADALKSFGQDVLEKAVEELLGAQAQGAGAALLAVAVGEGDVVAVVGDNAFGAERGAINIGGQVFEGGFSAADGLDIGDPILGPNPFWDLGEECGLVPGQGLFEAVAKTRGQDGLRQEIVLAFGTDPAQVIGGESAGGDDAVDMGMETQVAGPGLKDGEQAEFGSEILMGAADVLQRAGAVAQQEGVADFLMRADEGAQLCGDSEGDQIIRHWEESAPLALEPLGGIGMATLGTGAMIAGVISKVLAAAIALEELASEGGGPAGKNGRDGAPVRGQEARAKLPFVRRPVAAQDFGQCDQRRIRGRKLGFEWLVKCRQRGLGAGFADGRQVGVDDGGVE